ncbi:hypothetical protein BAUCODRAFT_32225 [Baudoinia panamericana UAMH 10762]|uniref:Uncharacterized protein n=1 Tax=Baudoinia panamericana (strain UAMH 10762) TaxID=717646 RepID=M2N2R6_BAUPA|nr:uncharacterized protein BAUCODRAFT_32225 [Baudoinia panamericana UAMH 10762]EMC98238.1 hypothetical protein BAUCODRAFT_32225 [Baudoinia panamericana UAMH 10762]
MAERGDCSIRMLRLVDYSMMYRLWPSEQVQHPWFPSSSLRGTTLLPLRWRRTLTACTNVSHQR